MFILFILLLYYLRCKEKEKFMKLYFKDFITLVACAALLYCCSSFKQLWTLIHYFITSSFDMDSIFPITYKNIKNELVVLDE